MDIPVVLIIGFAAVALALAVTVRRRSAGHVPHLVRRDAGAPAPTEPAPIEPAPGPRHLAPARIVVVGDRRTPTAHPERRPEIDAAPLTGPRLRLLRDASAALVGIAAVMIVASMVASPSVPAGEVLSATSRPAEPTSDPAATSGRATAPVAGAAASSRPSDMPTVAASAFPDASSAAATPIASATSAGEVPTPTATPPAIVRPSPAPVPGRASASRLALLSACPGQAGCYLYVVRSGDTLSRIATFFGIPSATILRLNPTITDPSIVVRGSVLVLPTPTR